MRSVRLSLFLFASLLVVSTRAQTPTVSQSVPAQTLTAGGTAVVLDLRNFFAVPGVTGRVAQIDTVLGRFNIELLENDAPRTVQNFLNYVNRAAYSNSFIHRSVPGFVIQGGGYTFNANAVAAIALDPAVQNEFKVPNTRGTLAMAKLGSDPNSATSQWFVNLADNRANLDSQNGGFTVFARVIGNGMSIVDQIAALQRVNASAPFDELPVRNFTGGNVGAENLVIVNSVSTVSLFPTGDGNSVVALSQQNSAPAVVTAALSGSTLTLTPAGAGSATITLRAVDTNGGAAETSFVVTVTTTAPVFTTQPVSLTAAAGTTVVLNSSATGAPSYRWQRNGTDVDGATGSTLVIANASAADAGTYTSIATNPVGSATSTTATISVVNVPELDVSRLINVSILTPVGAGAKILTMGTVIRGPQAGGSLPLVVRAVGPTLALPPPIGFGSPGMLPDPQMTLTRTVDGNPTPVGSNDNWSGADLSAAFTSVGAFALPTGSLDSALFLGAPGAVAGNYSLQVSGKGNATGSVLAEIYDASGANRTAASPRLINISVLKVLDAGDTLTAGFVLRGQAARTLLVRAIGPALALAPFLFTDAMTDPKLELFNASGKFAENDNWAGENHLSIVGARVGAFPVTNSASRDAMLLVTLPPGDYSARVSGVNGIGGNVIVEVYEVP